MFQSFIYVEFLVTDKVELEEHKTSGFIVLAISVRFDLFYARLTGLLNEDQPK